MQKDIGVCLLEIQLPVKWIWMRIKEYIGIVLMEFCLPLDWNRSADGTELVEFRL